MTTAIEKLTGLRAHADDRGIDPALVGRAEMWLHAFQQVCGSTWKEPGFVWCDGVEGEIQFSWYGRRNLGIAITLHTVEYIQMWGPDINNHMMSGTISTTQEQMSLWRWLREEK